MPAGTAVQFGAGNIGRGFTAQLFTESGYEVVFVDVIDEVVDLINERRSYPIEIASEHPETVTITNVRAVHGSDREAVAREIRDSSLVCTAVGVNVLRHVAPAIARGIELRADAGIEEPLNIIICENLITAGETLRGHILDALPSRYAAYMDERIGFVGSVVSRMVPVMTEEQKKRDPLLIIVEAYKRLPVDGRGFKGEVPRIVGFEPYNNFAAYIERKLFTHNLGHATSAYLGWLKGYEYTWQSMRDPRVRRITEAALAETGKALIERHGFAPEKHQAHIDDLLERFGNVALGDQVTRVGRDPIRKLGPEDRMIGGGKLCLEYGVEPTNVCVGTAAALLFDNPDDPAALEVQEMIGGGGLDRVFREVCGLDPASRLAGMIREQYERLRAEH
ncbi:MAG: mannitol-1-phosphate 5-dehydrogenase [Armatimonadetes bacterium]|nr:mannitol-1-phosphate 5-dehydrogenase [Armatimonadota bacterium]